LIVALYRRISRLSTRIPGETEVFLRSSFFRTRGKVFESVQTVPQWSIPKDCEDASGPYCSPPDKGPAVRRERAARSGVRASVAPARFGQVLTVGSGNRGRTEGMTGMRIQVRGARPGIDGVGRPETVGGGIETRMTQPDQRKARGGPEA